LKANYRLREAGWAFHERRVVARVHGTPPDAPAVKAIMVMAERADFIKGEQRHVGDYSPP
jgi:hypothetical protein